jgi:hypothetical protein
MLPRLISVRYYPAARRKSSAIISIAAARPRPFFMSLSPAIPSSSTSGWENAARPLKSVFTSNARLADVVATDLFDYLDWEQRPASTAGQPVVRLGAARG